MVISPERRTYVVVVRWTDELLCGGYKCVSPFETPCIHLHCWPHVLLSFTSLQEFVGLKIPHSVDRWTIFAGVRRFKDSSFGGQVNAEWRCHKNSFPSRMDRRWNTVVRPRNCYNFILWMQFSLEWSQRYFPPQMESLD